MPNQQNITSPVTLIAGTRSGTSLLHRTIATHPDFGWAGETAAVIFGPWYAVEQAKGYMRPTEEDGRRLSTEEKAARVVRSTFLALFHDGKPRWVHKPIGAKNPFFLRRARRQGMDAALEWYWRVMNHAFPDGSFITILRNPFDVALSQMDKFRPKGRRQAGESPVGPGEEHIWKDIARMAGILTHPHSSISHAVIYSDLVGEPESALTRLFADIEVPFHPRVMTALKKIHAPAPGREQIDPKATSRSADWHYLNPDFVTPDIERAIARLWSKFDARFDVPEHFAERGIQFVDSDGAKAASSISSQAQQLDSAERSTPDRGTAPRPS